VAQTADITSLKQCYSAVLRRQGNTFQQKGLNGTEEQELGTQNLRALLYILERLARRRTISKVQ